MKQTGRNISQIQIYLFKRWSARAPSWHGSGPMLEICMRMSDLQIAIIGPQRRQDQGLLDV